ncbi:MAG TPA: acyl-CoA dehydrogenase family protein [Pseudonocardiaceae bacterium]|nr:acyl-CoA dehydrogenase family protein [Pseudonocardiaceae bacterium]
MHTLLEPVPPKPLALPRSVTTMETELRRRALAGELTLPEPGNGQTPQRWSALATLGRTDLVLARLAEGHVDALAILAEAGRTPASDALYGVWAAKTGGTGAVLERGSAGLRLSGTVRFCSGASILDRALVAARGPDDADWLVEIDLAVAGVHPDPDSWPALGMDASDSLDVQFRDVPITEEMITGRDGWYVRRRGFRLGSGGVAAVWLGGAMGAYDRVLALLRERGAPDEHQLAHVGALANDLRATDALLADTAHAIDTEPGLDLTGAIGLGKSAAERVSRSIVDIAPRITGPGPLCWDPSFAQHLADLAVYIRQHHAERDLAGLGRHLLEHGEG